MRRAAVAWGDAELARDASDSTFYYTNSAPQHARFNQDEWLHLEDWVLQGAGGISPRLCVFTGPIYTLADRYDGSIRLPSAFWKIVVLRDPTAEGADLAALGFVMKQNEMWEDWNGAQILDLRLYQVGIAEIGRYAGLRFGDLVNLDEFDWRQPRFRNRQRMKPILVSGPEDITFSGNRRRAHGNRAIRVGRPAPECTEAVVAESSCDSCAEPARTPPLRDQVELLSSQVASLRSVLDSLVDHRDLEGPADYERYLDRIRSEYARVVGGVTVGWGDFPDCACIGDNQQWFCSGVLVAPRVVLTAAHCAPDIHRVYLGGQSIQLVGDFGEVVKVEQVIVHPDYDGSRVPSHDIAVLVLEADAQTTPVEIATAEEVDGEDNLVLVGFGYDHPTLDLGFGTKRQADVPLPPLQTFPPPELHQFEQKHGFDALWELYAGRKELGIDTCNGDSGGPAYIHTGETCKLAGLTSRAAYSSVARCGDGGIYTRVAPYLPWIRTVTGGLLAVGGEIPAPPDGGACFYISACMPNPRGGDRGNEWVEITNAGSQEGSLTGWAVADRQGGRFELAGPLPAGATHRVQIPEDSPVMLANSGDDVLLFAGDEESHRVSYGRAASGEVFRFEKPDFSSPDPEPDPDTPTGGLLDANPC